MRIGRSVFCFALAWNAALFGSGLLAQDISEFEKRLARINEQIKDLKVRIADEDKKESSVLSSLARIGFSKTLIRREMEANAVLLEKTNQELIALKADADRLRAKLAREQQAVEATLVTLYKYGRFDIFQWMLKTKNIDSLLRENKCLTILAHYQGTVISGFLAAQAELGAAETRLESKKQEISELLRNAEQKKKELEAEEGKNRDFVAQIRRNRAAFQQTLQEIDERAQQLQVLIKKMTDQEFTLSFPLIPLYEKKGKLAWPLDGKIITAFGRQKHHQFNTITMNNGIDISPRKSRAVIQSIHAGRVVYADAFEGYGNLIIIDHGLTYYSLYGHCSECLVNKGDIVKAGAPIALTGDTDSLKGECLYFEIRLKSKALDPLQWLKRR